MTVLGLALLLPWAAGVALLALDGRRPVVGWISVAAQTANLAVLGALATLVVTAGPQGFVTGGWPAGMGIVVRADALGVVFAVLSAVVVLGATVHEVVDGVTTRSFPALVMLLSTGLNGLFLTGDVFNFYVFFELAMICAYVLTTYGERRAELWAALVFAAANLLGSFVFLISVAGTYSVTATLAMEQVAARMQETEPAGILIATGFFIAFGVKLGLFPFHFWLPTVYTCARPAITAILSGALVNIGVYGVLRFGVELFPRALHAAAPGLIALGLVSIVYGAVLALRRSAAAETLAYSAVGQVGYVLVAIGVGGPAGLAAAVLYSVVNALNKALLFLTVGVRGALVAFAFAVGALSVAGVPPAAGFVGKLLMFRTGVAADSPAILAVMFGGGALSLLYMFQLYQRDFWSGQADRPPGHPAHRALPVAFAALLLVVGVWPEPLLAISETAAAALTERPS